MSKSKPVIAIGLDAADPTLIEPWIESGDLPNLRALSEQGTYSRLKNKVNYQGASEVEFSSTEPLWTMFLTGCLPDKTGFLGHRHLQPQRLQCPMRPDLWWVRLSGISAVLHFCERQENFGV